MLEYIYIPISSAASPFYTDYVVKDNLGKILPIIAKCDVLRDSDIIICQQVSPMFVVANRYVTLMLTADGVVRDALTGHPVKELEGKLVVELTISRDMIHAITSNGEVYYRYGGCSFTKLKLQLYYINSYNG